MFLKNMNGKFFFFLNWQSKYFFPAVVKMRCVTVRNEKTEQFLSHERNKKISLKFRKNK